MEVKRAQELLKVILETENYGIPAMEKATLEEVVYMAAKVLPECLQTATDNRVDNDVAFFASALREVRAYAVERLKSEEELWVMYSGLTGYPYYVDGCLVVLYNYENRKGLEDILSKAGYRVETGVVTEQTFKYEIGHMYRNGYQTVIFADGTEVMFKVGREEIYAYEDFYDDDYVMNPDLQAAMIDYFQEVRKPEDKEAREEMIVKRENRMFKLMADSEFIVPCLKQETEEELEISYPFIDIAKDLGKDGEVIAVPAFTDGFEMNKCYGDHRDNIMYKFTELSGLIEELGATGVVINYAGQRMFMDVEMLKNVEKSIG
ncbi:MAG: SseB family protein [Lachnospira sp.]|nr:SseB family protein [Lachnospira sp.]